MAKNEFCKKKGIFSDQSDAIKQLFHACARAKIYFKEYRVNSEIGSGFSPKTLPFFLSVTMSGLVRLSKTRYHWKDLSLLTLLLTNLLTETESKMGAGRKMCVVPKTTKAIIVEGLRWGCGVRLREKVFGTWKALCALIKIYFLLEQHKFWGREICRRDLICFLSPSFVWWWNFIFAM